MTTTAPSEAARILIVDDDRAFRRSTAELLRQEGYGIHTASNAKETGDLIGEEAFDLILLDLRMPEIGGLKIVETLRRRGELVPILMVSGYGSIDTAVRALQLGADDFLPKPVDPDELSERVAALIHRRPVTVQENDGTGIIGESRAIREVLSTMRQVAPTEATVLLTGETGTGKELFARAIHRLSARADGPFVPVNCAGLADNLLESELFGHVRGAFTGAVGDKPGLFEAAHGGTIFLDEVGDMSLRLQRALLRVLQEREVAPVGSVETRPVDVRVIAATHRTLADEVEAGRFRHDLYYRLNVFPIKLPPLRRRLEDIPLLVTAALRRVDRRAQTEIPSTVSPFVMRLFRDYRWPGNVRELFAVVESAAIRAGDTPRIEAQHLPGRVRREGGDTDGKRYQADRPGSDERAAVRAALEETGGVRTRAAKLLGMSRTTLWRKMREYELEGPG